MVQLQAPEPPSFSFLRRCGRPQGRPTPIVTGGGAPLPEVDMAPSILIGMSEPLPESGMPLHRRFLSLNSAIIERFGDQFRPLEPECKVIQFDQPLTPAESQKAAGLIVNRPDVQLYVYGRATRDLSFLHYFPTLK